MVISRQPYKAESAHVFSVFRNVVEEAEYKKAHNILNYRLSELGVRVPTLFKQYVELCHTGAANSWASCRSGFLPLYRCHDFGSSRCGQS